MKIIPETHSTN